MKPNLDTLKREIPEYLESKGLAVFQGIINQLHEQKLVFWDSEKESDYRPFVDCAVRSGIKLMIFNYRQFQRDMVEDTLQRLEDCDLPREEARGIERRLKELRPYDGFTCGVELIFEHNSRCYVFDLRTEWYEELLEIMDQIDSAGPVDEDTDIEGNEGMSGYFSRN